MGRKGNDVSFAMILTFVMILMLSSLELITCSTKNECFLNCIRKCPSEDYQCYDRCGWDCPHKLSTSYDYCNFGCVLRRCSKMVEDSDPWRACRHTCYVGCGH
ncbi:hypothetical protein P3L10_033045 [Capsicum annuum]